MNLTAQLPSVAARLKKRIQAWHRRQEEHFLARLPVVPDGHVEAIRAAIPPAAPGAVALELGAGANRKWAHLFEGTSYRYVALDVEEGRPNTAGYVQASADSVPIRSRSVDIAVSFEMLEHCREPALVVSEIARVLKPG